MEDIYSIFEKPKNPTEFEAIKIRLASPEKIRAWSYGEVRKPETINYRTFKPERDGLFCAKIFGPVKDWECICGKYKRMKHRGVVCDKCGVEVIQAKSRRERLGHIELATPVAHIWFLKGIPSRIGTLLDMTMRMLEKVLYFESYIVVDPGETKLKQNELLTDEDYRKNVQDFGDQFKAGVGAEALRSNISEHVVDASSLRLTINGGTAPAIVAHSDSGGSANLEWSVPDRLGEQFLLLISDGIVPGSNRCPDEVATRRRGETDPEEHAQRHSSNGNIDLNLSSYLGEHTYYIWGCALRGGSVNGHSTNVVPMRYGYSLDITDFGTGGPEVVPNLQVSNVAVDQDNQTRFIVTINNVNGPLDWTWARAYRAHRNRVLGTEQTIEELLTFAVYLSVENRGSGYPSDLAHAALDPSSGQQQVIVTSPWSFPIDGEPHRIRVFVNEDLDVLESNYDDNSLIFTRQLEPRQLNIVLFGMNQMQVHYDGDDGSGPGELLRIERSMGRYNGDGTYSGGPNVSPSHMRNETSRALHGSSVDYLLIHDGDLLDTPFPSSRTTLAEDQTLRILFSARDDDSPCLSGRCYEQGVSVYDLDLATVPVVPGGCAENTHDFSGLLEARGPSVPDLPGPILRPTNGQYCVYYRYSPGVVSTEE